MSHHQSITQFHQEQQQEDNRIILPLNLDLIDDDDSDSGSEDEIDSDSDSDDFDFDFDDEIDVYDDEIDDIEEEEEEDDELNEVMSDRVSVLDLDLDDGVVVNGDGDSEVSWCGRGDGLICPICFEGWTSGGEHQMCCLPCGHIYGLSCINKWLQRFRGPGKCPQCKNLCTLKGVRVLYASRLCAADEELHERVRALEAKCADLEQKATPLTPEELIDQICSNPTLVQRLAAALAELNQQQVIP